MDGERRVCGDHCDRIGKVVIPMTRADQVANQIVPPRAPNVPTANLDAFSTVSENECPLCLENHESLQELTACGHQFCAKCLAKQINSTHKNRHRCAPCRKDIFDLPKG